MLQTSARLLRLLSLLQARRDWTSAELATALGAAAELPAAVATRRADAGGENVRPAGSGVPAARQTCPRGPLGRPASPKPRNQGRISSTAVPV